MFSVIHLERELYITTPVDMYYIV